LRDFTTYLRDGVRRDFGNVASHWAIRKLMVEGRFMAERFGDA
jgi:hypothetical protein